MQDPEWISLLTRVAEGTLGCEDHLRSIVLGIRSSPLVRIRQGFSSHPCAAISHQIWSPRERHLGGRRKEH